MILKKELKAHEKLQPIRKLSEFIGVNNTTVVKAYELLENEGYIYKVIGSGTFVSSRNKNEDIKIEKDGKDSLFSGYWKVYNNPGRAKMIFWAYDKAKTSAVNEYLIGKNIRDIAYVAAC